MDKEIPEMKNHTFTASCKGVKIAEAISRILIHESRWFSVDPLPGDEYAFEVHTDASFPAAQAHQRRAGDVGRLWRLSTAMKLHWYEKLVLIVLVILA
jgi:hypothetical protein